MAQEHEDPQVQLSSHILMLGIVVGRLVVVWFGFVTWLDLKSSFMAMEEKEGKRGDTPGGVEVEGRPLL